MTEPRIRATVVGSYPIPGWLAFAPSRTALRDALMAVLKTQELAGLDVVSDGELSRFDINHPETNGMIDYFLRPMEGVRPHLSRAEREAFHNQPGMGFRSQPAGVVEGPIGEGTLDLPADYAFVRPLTKSALKFTVTSPYMLAKTLLDRHYQDREALVMAIAEVLHAQVQSIDADVLQVDEANLPGSPEDGPLAARAINRVLAAANGEKGVHLCFGNYGGQTIQKGLYQNLLPFLNALDCNHLVLEFARRKFVELEVLRDLKAEIKLGLGVVDIKDNEVEPPETIAQHIEHAAEVLGENRIGWVHPDCGFWMLPRSVADSKMRALVEGRNRFLGIGEQV